MSMRYFESSDGIIHAFNEEHTDRAIVTQKIILKGLTEITEEEAKAKAENRDPVVDAQVWVAEELKWCDLQRDYFYTGDIKRTEAPLIQVNQYAIACRDYVIKNDDGVYEIVPPQPVRPSREEG